MKFGSLFAGIGGFDLGLERAGMSCQWQVEIEDYPTKILEKHWPEVHRERDIKECSGSNLEDVDLICGGFPCQDISVAGLGKGLAGERSGLWNEMHRIVSDIKPRWVIVENVAALLSRGMDVVLRDLSTIGYDCEWHVISASAVGAPHRRERVWIIANANGFNDAMRRNCQVDAAEMAGRDGNARGGQRDSRTGCTEITGEGSCDVPNANIIGTQIPVEGEQSAKQMLERFSWWEAEPSVGRDFNGFPNFLDRHTGRGMSHEESQRSVEVLRNLWCEDIAQAFFQSLGRLNRIQTAEILFAFVREYESRGWLSRQFVPCKKTFERMLRTLRDKETLASTPQKQNKIRQHRPKHSDALQVLSRQVASWDTFETGIDRVAHGIPRRVDRLKGLGNAVVPQVVELIGRRIMEIEGQLN